MSFRDPHTSGNPESRNKIRSFSNKQTGSRVHARDDNYNDRSPTKFLGDDNKKAVIKIGVILNWRPARCGPQGFQNLPIVLFVFCIVVVVILESRSPGSGVIKKEENNRYWTETFQYDLF